MPGRWLFRSSPTQQRSTTAGSDATSCVGTRLPLYLPVLHLQGTQDGCVLEPTAERSGRFVRGRYTYHAVEGAGHFLSEEAPEEVDKLLLAWLDGLDGLAK